MKYLPFKFFLPSAVLIYINTEWDTALATSLKKDY